eukprot:1774583-Prymnesium_polylepis.1
MPACFCRAPHVPRSTRTVHRATRRSTAAAARGAALRSGRALDARPRPPAPRDSQARFAAFQACMCSASLSLGFSGSATRLRFGRAIGGSAGCLSRNSARAVARAWSA